MSQYLVRTDRAIHAESDPFRTAELRALRALYLVRASRFQEAQEEIDDIRREFGNGQSGRVTCFLMIAEGVKQHYQSFGAAATDRLSRSLILGQAMRDTEVVALAAAWKGFLDFEYSRFESMSRTLALSGDSWGPDDHTARTRVYLVLMISALVLGELEAAQRYFKCAHYYAVLDGDQASIEALLFDRAAFGLSRQRLEWARGQEDAERLKRIKLELESARNLNQMININILVDHVPLNLARSDLMLGDFAKAASELETFIGIRSFPSSHLNDSALRTELAFCQMMAGDLQRAQGFATLIDVDELSTLDPDERLVLSKMLLALQSREFQVLGAASLADFALRAATELEAYEARLREAVSTLRARLPETPVALL